MYIYRCNKRLGDGVRCYTSHNLKRKIEQYIRKPRCNGCGALLTYRDHFRERLNKQRKCGCDGYHFPHRKGSKWCEDNRHNLTDKDYEGRT